MEGTHKKSILEYPTKLRNICIMAHVDHGKTTLADALIATNGIITQRQAGKIRYMDSRKDEVERGITMKSSCVTLTYKRDDDIYVVNLIDSPGHVDFSSEVSTAVRLCDGTLIVVDIVEGVCAQTKVVLRQAWLENIRPVLVLNKIDRLILEMKLTPLDAYYHITKVLEQVNAFMGELYNTDVLGRIAEEEEERKQRAKEKRERRTSEGLRVSEAGPLAPSHIYSNWTIIDIDDSDLYFSPERGNVTFASAFDGWGFRLSIFADKYHKKFDLDAETLNSSLWGDFYLMSKGGKKVVAAGAREKAKTPLFVSLILENVYKIYDAIMIKKDTVETEKIANTLGIKLPLSISKSSDHRLKLNFMMSSWLSLAGSILEMVVLHLPSPCEVTEDRACKLMCTATQRFDSLPSQTQQLKEAFVKCSSHEDAPLIVYISKMFGVEKKCISQRSVGAGRANTESRGIVSMQEIEERRKQIQNRGKESEKESGVELSRKMEEDSEEPEAKEELIAFARVFSGTLRVGQKVYVLGPKHNPNTIVELVTDENSLPESVLNTMEHVHVSEIKDIFLLMGRHLERVKSAPAGAVIGIGSLERVLKSATLSSTAFCPPFTELTLQATPILRVAVEPSDPRDLTKLRNGLKILNHVDPCVQVQFEGSGEYVIVTAGEVHLQRCIQDLEERYARVALTVSPPIVPFRETIIPQPTVDRLNEAILGENVYVGKVDSHHGLKDGTYKVSNSLGKLRVQAIPLPTSVTSLLEQNSHLLQMLSRSSSGFSHDSISSSSQLSNGNEMTINFSKNIHQFSEEALSAVNRFKSEMKTAFDESGVFWEGALHQIWSFGPNYDGCNILLNRIKSYPRPSIWEWSTSNDFQSPLVSYDTNFVTGFQMATIAGPLCEEPMTGVCFVIDEWEVSESSEGLFSGVMGQVISLAKDSLRKAFENSHQRLMCAMYSCVVNVTSEVVGRLYNLIGKRHGRVIDGDITEGSTSWNVTAYLPVVESFNFANELRKSTSGEAMPQLVFSHWEVLEIDPFWEPQTTEEVTHWGEKADSENLAMKYINTVRKRKGLSTDDKIVQFAEKQRNLSKNK